METIEYKGNKYQVTVNGTGDTLVCHRIKIKRSLNHQRDVPVGGLIRYTWTEHPFGYVIFKKINPSLHFTACTRGVVISDDAHLYKIGSNIMLTHRDKASMWCDTTNDWVDEIEE